ncbi:YdcF family protein [Candidatus Falkowbacteria bacterium]|nr:YdcF family protein [Candidatus Falkowbacteria bacterium]
MNKEFLKLQELLLKQSPENCQAIVWLQGDRYDRGPKTLELFKKGLALKIIISGNNKLIGPKKRPGENNVSLKDMKRWLLRREVKNKDIIIDADSLNTRDQSLNVSKIAKKNRWKKIIIVGSYPHYQARYFLTFIKGAAEVGWRGKIINQFARLPENKKPGGRKETAGELTAEEFKKIEEYQLKGHVADIRSGINYLI